MRIALKSLQNGLFVSARVDEPGVPLRATRPDAGPYEQFEIVELDAPRPAPRPSAFPLWAGCSDFRLAQRQMAGENLTPILDQRKAVGANLLRVFAMKADNTGWSLIPSLRADYFGDVRHFFDTIGPTGLRIEWTVFADTALLPAFDQQAFWHQTCEVVRAYPFVYLELLNEAGHPTQRLDPQAFAKPADVVCSHGSGLTDAHPVEPYWTYATYHARRDGAKGFSNYDPYEFESRYPQPVPFIPDEGCKPQDYHGDPGYAYLMGSHAALGFGGTFHSDSGIDSRLLTDVELICATKFFEGVRR